MTEAASPSVLVVDDEAQIRRFLGIALRTQGYRVLEAADGESALATLGALPVDLVVLDLGLPDRDGADVLRGIRARSQLPVVVLSVRANEAEKVKLLDLGANDYVTKPFGVPELMARIRALLRQQATGGAVEPLYDDGDLRIDLARREVSRGGERVSLSRREFALLSILVRHAGRAVTQPQLLRELWGGDADGDPQALRVLLGRLRLRLHDPASDPKYIQTEPGVGLRFRPQRR
jgi:two-component system, OmpR family, KDP operon response regulator KdpE